MRTAGTSAEVTGRSASAGRECGAPSVLGGHRRQLQQALADGDYKPRTTLGRQRKVRPAVLESELRLPRHRGYLLFPDGLPVARIALSSAGHWLTMAFTSSGGSAANLSGVK